MAVTKHHKTSQRGTLSTKHLNAIDLLVLGRSDRDVAEQVEVSRETVTRWRNDNPYFVAELNRKRQSLWHGDQDRLRALVGKAVDILEQALEDGDVKAAIAVLKAVKLYGNVEAPGGETDPELVLVEQAERWAREEGRRYGPPDDPTIELLFNPAAHAQRTRQRLEELRDEHLT